MKILAINSGSSSIKFELFDMRTYAPLAAGLLERIGDASGRQSYRLFGGNESIEETTEAVDLKDHQQGVRQIAYWLKDSGAIKDDSDLIGIAHRVAHGGAELRQPTIIDDQILAAIRNLTPLAPLHNPANICGIEVTMAQWPNIPQVAIFDTAFHHTIPPHAHQYALPTDLARYHNIRRYGFHGTSHQYVAREAANLLGLPLEKTNLIVLHLGNGASATAIQAGQSIDTSMGFTPLEGLMMGTRCGDLDPGVVLYLSQSASMSVEEVNNLLNKSSGLMGICGDNDMREVLRRADNGDQQAVLAIEMYTYRIKKYIGSYTAILPNIDALVFTAGVGEHSTDIRAKVCSDLQHLGISVDLLKNSDPQRHNFEIQPDTSKTKVFVIPTNEELEMAKQAFSCISDQQ